MVVNIRVLIIYGLLVVGLFLLNKNASNSDVNYVKHSINYNNTNSSSRTNNEERLRMALHIAFYQVPNSPREEEKFDSLRRVLKAVETYTDLYQVDIIIHTNELKDQPPLLTRVGYNCTLTNQCPIVTVLQHNIQQLPHPHYLTWMHRPAMIEQMNSTKYDLYAYIEDDQIISRKNILYHQTYSKIAMEEEGCSLGFVRVIDKRYTNGTLYFQPNPQYGRTYLHSKRNTTSPLQWARIERDATYWAGWMMEDGPALRAFSSSPEFPYRTLHEFIKTFSDMDATAPMGYAGRCIINQDGKWAGTRGISAIYVPQTNIFEGVTFKDSDSYVYRFWDDGSTDMSILLWKTNDKGSSPSESSWSAFGHSTWMSTEEAAPMLNMTAAELTPETFGNVYADVWAETNAEDDEVTVQESSSFRNTMKPALVLSLVMLNFFM